MLECFKRWLTGGTDSLPEPEGGNVESAAVKQCLQAYRCGLEQFQVGKHAAAKESFDRALGYKHDFAAAHFYLGLIYRQQVQLDAAIDELQQAVALKPDFVQARFYLGITALESKRYDEAADSFNTVLQIRPADAKAHNGLGKICEVRKQYREAAAHYTKAIELSPGYALAHTNLAYVTFRETLDAKAALVHAHRAVELKPQLADAHSTLAMILQYQGEYQESILACNTALQIEPGLARARMMRGLAQLMLGDFASGWSDYESRRQVIPLLQIRTLPYPEWDGSPLAGKQVLVYYEQGIGDEIMFASCLPDMFASGARCVVECSYKLERLFRRSFPAATFVVADQTSTDLSYLKSLPKFDWQVAAGSLPLRYRRSWEDFPRHDGYLTADPKRIDYWRERLRELGPGRKIGLSWHGGFHSTNRAARSIELESLRPLLRIPGAHFISLQYSDCQEEIDRLRKMHGLVLHHWQEAIDDYSETAALVSALDLVVSVQTAVIHLAGALGRPVWALVPSTPEWRYMADGTRMPWYPSVRIFRQTRGADWKAVVMDVRQELMTGQDMTQGGDRR